MKKLQTLTRLGQGGRQCRVTELKESISARVERIVRDVRAAAEYHIAQEYNMDEKLEKLRGDIKNVVFHVFGSHEQCAAYFCNGEMKDEERNLIPSLRNIGLFDHLQDAIVVFTKHFKSLLTNKTSNIAESFFALVCKTNNGKRTLVSQRGAYGAHIAVAVVTHNTAKCVQRILGIWG